ncbi:MAG: hypothetical protein [Caudoviricetes sp.]|nr:MAG: hypothetical protein [Caudoviricetes sp.]
MNLYAYMQIDDLDEIAKKNNIEIPRLRGYEWMENETPIPEKDTLETIETSKIHIVENLCRSGWDPGCHCYSYNYKTSWLVDYYIGTNKDGNPIIRWDRIHGKKRKMLKLKIKQKEKKIRQQDSVYNKYAGMKNVLYVHARIGGDNWKYLSNEVRRSILDHPGFLARVDSAYDSTYCDIYFQVNE